jgi:hypothetical protein
LDAERRVYGLRAERRNAVMARIPAAARAARVALGVSCRTER